VVGQRQVRSRLEETGQKEPRLGRMSARKHSARQSLAGNRNFTPALAISRYLRVSLEKSTSSPMLLIHMEEYKYHQSLPEIQ